jgi:hypothetical protein
LRTPRRPSMCHSFVEKLLLRIPAMPITYSGPSRSVIPIQADH